MPRPTPIIVPAPNIRTQPDEKSTGVAALEGLSKIISSYKENEKINASAQALKALLGDNLPNVSEEDLYSVVQNPTLMSSMINAAKEEKSKKDLQSSVENYYGIKGMASDEIKSAAKALGLLGGTGEAVLSKSVGTSVMPKPRTLTDTEKEMFGLPKDVNWTTEEAKDFGLKVNVNTNFYDDFMTDSVKNYMAQGKAQSEAKSQALKDWKALQVELAGAKAYSAGIAQFELPMTVSESGKLRHPKTFAPAPMGMTKSKAAKEGYVEVSDKQINDYYQVEQGNQIISQLEKIADKLITAKNFGEQIKQKATLGVGAVTGTNSDAKLYQDYLKGFMVPFAKGTLRESGVMTDPDIERYANLFPTFMDTKETKDKKFAALKEFSVVTQEITKKAIFGGDRKELRKEFLQKLEEAEKKAGIKKQQTTTPPVSSGKVGRFNVEVE